MLDQAEGPLIFLNFAIHRKKEFLRDVRPAYDGIVLTGNVLLYQYKSTPMVVFSCRSAFFVDPMSYLFGQPYEEFKQRVTKGPRFKPSFDRLMKGHGLVPDAFLPVDYRSLVRYLLESEQNLSTFTDNALGFQWENVWKTIQEAREYLPDDDQSRVVEAEFRPRFVIPPYFLYSPPRGDRTSIINVLNERILDYAWNSRDSWGDIFPAILVRKGSLQDGFVESLTAIARKHAYPGYCLWVEDFDERFVTAKEITGVIELVRSLSAGGRQVVILHGGFFSMLLSYFGVTCVCHGLAYGEAKTVKAATKQSSGPTPVRYYVRDLHRFLTLDNALVVLRQRRELICRCPVCRRIVGNDPERITRFRSEEALAEIHFLHNRREEQKMISASSLEEAIDSLKVSMTLYADIAAIKKRIKTRQGYEDRSIIDPGYIQEWITALEGAAI